MLIKAQDGISKREWAYEQCKKRADRYKQALEKIERIVNQDIAFMGYSDEFDDLILNEINEVKNGTNG